MTIHRSILLFLFLLVLFASDAIAQSIATISVSDITVSEGDATATFSVTHHGADVPGGFTITVASQDITADSNDYTAVNTNLIFTGTAGETKTVQIPIIDNRIAEGPETFTLNMSIAGTTETVDIPNMVTVTILDDDILAISVEGPPGSTARSISVNEDVRDAQVCIRFNIAYDIEFEVQVFSFRLTATPDVDYQKINRTLTATTTEMENTERCFPFAIVNDNFVEDDETLDISIFFSIVPTLNIDLTNATLRYTIIDNDNAVLSVDEIMVDENAGHADVVVAVNKRVEETFTVGVSTLDGTAIMGMDYGALTNAPLIFPARTDGNNATQTIRVPIVNDFIMEDTETFSISFTHLENTGVSDQIALPAPTTVTISDNDITTIGIVLSSPLLTVDEGNSNTYTVVLNTQPTVEVTVTINGEGDVSAVPSNLTFTTTDWANPQTVTVNAAQDDDAFNDIAILAHNAAGGNYNSLMANLNVTVDDDDIAGITLSPEPLTVDEGASNTYMVVLNTLPTTEVTVTISSRGDITAMPSNLTFTTTDWSDPQMVTVNARQEDNDALNDNAALSHNAAGNEYDTVLKNLSVTIMDDDTARFTFTPSPLTVPEGGSSTYSLAPTILFGNISALYPNISSSDDDVTIVQPRQSFDDDSGTPRRFLPMTITVRARHDDDAADKEVTLQHTAADLNNIGYRTLMQDFVITILDDDIAGFTFNPTTTLPVAEGSNSIYTVALNTEPTDAVTVMIESNNSEVTTTPPSLDFTVSNWRVPQTVMVNVGEDNNAVNDDVMLTHTASGGDYGANNVMGALSITTEDNDTAGISFSSANVIMDEEIVQIYTVVLDTEPTADVTVAIGSDNTDVTVVPGTLTFNPTSWNTVQTVMITAAHDDDAVNDDVNLTHIAMGGDYGDNSVMATLPVEVIDNDTPGISFNPASVTVAEGTTQTYTVFLNTQPTAEVTFIIGSNNADVTVNPPGLGPLTFSTTNWSVAQTVTITAAEDDDAVNDDAMLTHTASGGDYERLTVNLAVTVDDDDTAGISFNPAPLASVTVDEGTTQTYTVVLDTEPTAVVTIAIASNNTDVTVAPQSLTFNPTSNHWRTPQTVTITAAEDDDAVDDSANLTHTVSGGDYAGLTAEDIAVAVDDNDTAGISFNPAPPASVTVDEGITQTYTVVLDTEPTAAVTVAIASNNSDVTVAPQSLDFTISDWREPKTVTVTAAEDNNAVDDNATLMHTASGGDYDGLTADIAVTVDDDDTAGISFNPASASVTVDEGTEQTYTVVLDSEPTTEVTVAIVSINTAIASSNDVTVSPGTLTFNPTSNLNHWSTPQTVTITAAEDDDAVDDSANLRHTATGGDYGDNNVTAVLPVTVTDPDTAGITFSRTSITMDENAQESYTVVLNTQPTAEVTVMIDSNNADVAVDPRSLTFTTTDWDTAQPVTITEADDADAVDDTANLTHTARGGDYTTANSGNPVSGLVTVEVTDPETAGIIFTPATVAVNEGAVQTYTVELDTQPTAGVTVTIASNNLDGTVEPTTLTFSTANWDEGQPVRITAAEDNNAVDDNATLMHTASGGDYAGLTADIAVTVDDDDTAGISFNPASASVTVDEGTEQTYTVVLDSEPTTEVTVAIVSINTAIASSNDVTVSPGTLTFNPTSNLNHWSTPQTVTITAAEDDDAVDDSANLRHTATGGDYGDNNVTAVLPVTVTDPDTAGITFSRTSITMDENAQESYTVVLNTQPTAEVTVMIDSNNADVAVDPRSLTFTTTDWDTAQPVTITEADDADAVDDTANLTHTARGGDYTTANSGNPVSGLVTVEVTDPETAGIIFTPATVAVNEGAVQTYTVELDTQPTAGVTVTIASNNLDGTVEPTTLTFSTANWDEGQPVRITAAEDDDNDDYEATLAYMATGGDYTTENVRRNLTINVNDTDDVSSESRLSGLTISANGTLDPAFDPNKTDYELIIDNIAQDSTNIMVTATLSDGDSATAELILNEVELARVGSETETGREIAREIEELEPGRNDLQIVVTPQVGSSRVYAITIARIDQVVLNNVKLVPAAATDCNAASVAAVRLDTRYSACVDRFPLNTFGMAVFTTLLQDDIFATSQQATFQATPNEDIVRADMVDLIDENVNPSSVTSITYLMMKVTIGTIRPAVHEVRYPITNMDLAATVDTDNDGIPDTEERGTNSPTNLVIADMAAGTTMRQITVPQGHRIALGDAARRAAIAGLESSGGLTYTAELRLSTTELASIGISEPDGYNEEGIYDFVVYLPTVDNVASIVIPLASPLTAGLGYMKYKDGVWDAFADDNMAYPNDKYYSAPREDMRVNNMGMPEFICPLHNDLAKWTLRMPQQPLTPGHRCILLRISDGSPNDADGSVNGIVVDPGALASISGPRSGGSGASDLWFILLLTLINLAVFILRRKQIASTQRK